MFKGYVAIITGSRRGLGEAIAYELASRGCNIVINDREEENRVEQVVKTIKEKYAVDAIGIMADISKEDGAKKVLNETLTHFGKVDILVNNAAIVSDLELGDRTLDLFNKTILNNISSTFIMSKLIGEEMMKAKFGKIINISSTNGINAYFPTSIDYDCGKSAVISLTNNFALAYAPYVNVNAVAPGWINTEMNSELPDELIARETEKIFLHRFAEPEEIAKLVAFLASDDAKYINGETIKIDGGYQ